MDSTAAAPAPGEHRLPHDALPSSLRPHLLELYEVPYPPAPPEGVTVPISAGVTPILNVTFEGRAVIEASGAPPVVLPFLVLSGPQPDAYTATLHGEVRGFYATFPAAGPLALLGVRHFGRMPPPPVAAVVRPALAAAATTFEADLRGATDFETRAALTLAFLSDALAGAPAADLDAAAFLSRVIAAVESAEGRVRVDALAAGLGVSAPTLRRRFAVLGVSVKRYAEIVRFRAAHAFLHAAPGVTWSDVVDRFGYADQAHFVRAYRRMAGVPPTRWDGAERAIDRRMGIEAAPAATPTQARE